MRLVRLLYTSRQVSDLDLAAVRALNRVAQSKNEQVGLSGLLCYAPPFFAQCLEGSRTAVSRVMDKIYRDPRHADLTLIEFAEVDERVFPDWSMRLVDLTDLPSERVRRVCLRHGGAMTFRPDVLSAKQLLGFLRDLVAPCEPPLEPAVIQATG